MTGPTISAGSEGKRVDLHRWNRRKIWFSSSANETQYWTCYWSRMRQLRVCGLRRTPGLQRQATQETTQPSHDEVTADKACAMRELLGELFPPNLYCAPERFPMSETQLEMTPLPRLTDP